MYGYHHEGSALFPERHGRRQRLDFILCRKKTAINFLILNYDHGKQAGKKIRAKFWQQIRLVALHPDVDNMVQWFWQLEGISANNLLCPGEYLKPEHKHPE
ncbi:MAG: hypothetical protein OEV89_00665 [Desulfobulbaceae bacterium]|nr:hypothetical protein [Desulfobulbaceae bacterium]HIJ89355.1 hypothetical protein [Deltaproteobacteria bacterium]